MASSPTPCSARRTSHEDFVDREVAVEATSCKATSKQLQPSTHPLTIIFLDLDGVIAPRLNAGQILRQCVDGVVAVCRMTNARIVLSSSWRLLPGKVAMINQLLQREHGLDEPCYDVTPDLRGVDVDVRTPLDPARFVRVNERSGFTANDAIATLRVLTAPPTCLTPAGGFFGSGEYMPAGPSGLSRMVTDGDVEMDDVSESLQALSFNGSCNLNSASAATSTAYAA